MMQSRIAVLAAGLVVLASCADGGIESVTDPTAGGPAFLISDAAHLPGRTGFVFRPPLVADAPFTGPFDGTLHPVARVCRLVGEAPYECGPVIATFHGGSGPMALTVDPAGESYTALWQTPADLQRGRDRYRLEVHVGDSRLGFADLWFVLDSKELKAVSESAAGADYVVAVAGGNIPVKFRIGRDVIGTVEVAPADVEQPGPGTRAFTATVRDLHGAPVVGRSVAWTSSDPSIATVAPAVGATDGDGRASTTATTATASGTTTIAAAVGGVSGTASMTVILNVAPIATDDAYATDEDAPLVLDAATGVLANDTDPDAGALAASLVAGPAHGVLALAPDGSFEYTPDPDFHGADAFAYVASDGTENSEPATVRITVAPVNDPPVALDDGYAVNEDGQLIVAAANGVLANDIDVDDAALTAAALTIPVNGSLAFQSDGSFVYTPKPNFNGVESFTYRASDGASASNLATVTITVRPVNDAPVAVGDRVTTTAETPVSGNVLTNDFDLDGDALTAAPVSGPANGSVTLNPDGTFTYTPNPGFDGSDSFTYRANDGAADSNVATVSITVNPAAAGS